MTLHYSLILLPTCAAALAAQKDKPVQKDALFNLPADLPVPVDDGAAKHLPGMKVPAITLVSTSNRRLNMADVAPERTVIYCYPRTGQPGVAIPKGWDEIPGARAKQEFLIELGSENRDDSETQDRDHTEQAQRNQRQLP